MSKVVCQDSLNEALFRQYFCRECIYWNGEPHYSGRKKDYSKEEWAEVMEEVDPASCGLPGTKDCPLQDWKTYAKAAKKYAKALRKYEWDAGAAKCFACGSIAAIPS